MKRIEKEFERLRDGRDLTPFEESAVYAVARLIIELEQASQQVLAEGVIIDDGKGFPVEHPALMVEKRCSSEIRGWVKDRPDLFGGATVGPAQPEKPAGGGLAKFKVV